MALDVLLSVGLLLTTASQLRTFLSVIGPGELFLLLWIALNLFREADRLGPTLTPPLTRLLTFWVVFALALGIGTIVGFAMEQTRDTDGYKHDALAYLLTAIVSCLLVVEPQCTRLRRVAWLLVSLGSIAILAQIVAAEAGVTLPFIDLWFWDRFRGWSDDPNVFAMLCAVLLFVAIHLMETAAFTGDKAVAIACCLPPLYAGLLSHSDSFVVALVFGGTTILALWPSNWLGRSDRKATWRFLSVGTVALLLLALEYATGWISQGISAVAYDDNDQVWIRLALWHEAIKVGLDSYLLGFGPGPHLQTPYVQLRGTTVREAHNVILHVLTQGGIIAVASCIWITATCMVAVYRQRLVALTALLCALAAFSMFHFLIRHPLFWFAIALTLVAGTQARYAPAYVRQTVRKPVAARLKRRAFPTWATFSRLADAAGGHAWRVLADRAQAGEPVLAEGASSFNVKASHSTPGPSSKLKGWPIVPLPYLAAHKSAANNVSGGPSRSEGDGRKTLRFRPAVAAVATLLAVGAAVALWQVEHRAIRAGGGESDRPLGSLPAEEVGSYASPAPEQPQEAHSIAEEPATGQARIGTPASESTAIVPEAPSRGSFVSLASTNAPIAAVDQPRGQVAEPPPAGTSAEKTTRAAPPLPDVATLIVRGDALLRLFDVAGARLFYARAEKLGSARAATAMAKTYDPLFLAAGGVVGVRPDARQAIDWYQRAMNAGDPDSASYLVALVQRLQQTSEIDAAEAAALLRPRQ